MGQTFHLMCETCKEELWIGQNSLGCDNYLYTGEKELKNLKNFLFRHYTNQYDGDHNLKLVELNDLPDKYKDFEEKENEE